MPLRTRNQLPRRFAKLVNQAERIDVAVAWVRPCEAVNVLAQSSAKIRIVVGISKYFTEPSTLKRLVELENVELRIVPNKPARIFHPKYFCFYGENAICWVGSANLTGGGFGGNVELVHEFELKRGGDRTWFECLWESLEQDPWQAIREYEERYTQQKRNSRQEPPQGAIKLPSLANIQTWDQFVRGLKAYDAYCRQKKCQFDVLGETHSWLHTIRTGHNIASLKDWANLTLRECRILRGITVQDDGEGNWEVLGGVRGGGNYVFNPARMPTVKPIRLEIQKQIDQVLQADSNNIIEVAVEAMETIRQLKHLENADRGIGHAAATRWLALARPDCLVSVNEASERGLGEASGFPQNSAKLAKVYADLLTWIHNRPWFKEFDGQSPVSSLEWEIWNCRAALVDVFVYRAIR